MTFIQVSLQEAGGVASGYDLRNRANLSDLSICVNDPRPISFPLRPATPSDRSATPLAPTVKALNRQDIADLLACVAARKPAFVLVEGVHLLLAIEALHSAFPAVPILLDMHNVESLLQIDLDRARLPRLPLLPRLLWPLADAVHRKRHRAAALADHRAIALSKMVWTCSQADAALTRSHFAPQNLHVIANPIPDWCADYRAPAENRTDGTPENQTVLFVGHLGYPPNRQAVTRLCTEIMPALRHRIPQARLHVCGRNPHRRLLRLVETSGHRLTANPPDLGPLYAQATVTAIPLTQGGGTRIKVLEALATGCPVVASSKAVEGLGLQPDRHFLLADSNADFTQALATLLGDAPRRAGLAAAGRAFVAEHFAPAARQARIRQALATLPA